MTTYASLRGPGKATLPAASLDEIATWKISGLSGVASFVIGTLKVTVAAPGGESSDAGGETERAGALVVVSRFRLMGVRSVRDLGGQHWQVWRPHRPRSVAGFP